MQIRSRDANGNPRGYAAAVDHDYYAMAIATVDTSSSPPAVAALAVDVAINDLQTGDYQYRRARDHPKRPFCCVWKANRQTGDYQYRRVFSKRIRPFFWCKAKR